NPVGIVDDLPVAGALDVGHEADTAAVVFVLRIVQPVRFRGAALEQGGATLRLIGGGTEILRSPHSKAFTVTGAEPAPESEIASQVQSPPPGTLCDTGVVRRSVGTTPGRSVRVAFRGRPACGGTGPPGTGPG